MDKLANLVGIVLLYYGLVAHGALLALRLGLRGNYLEHGIKLVLERLDALNHVAELHHYLLQEADAELVCLHPRGRDVVVALGRLVGSKHFRRCVGERVLKPSYGLPLRIGHLYLLRKLLKLCLHVAYLLLERGDAVRAVAPKQLGILLNLKHALAVLGAAGPLVEQYLLYVAAYVARVTPYLLALYVVELFHAVGAEALVVVVVGKLGELGKPLFLLKLFLHEACILLHPLLPGDAEVAPPLGVGSLDYGLGQREAGVGEQEPLTVLLVLDLVEEAGAHLFERALAVANAVLPQVIGQLARGLHRIAVRHELCYLGFGILYARDAE